MATVAQNARHKKRFLEEFRVHGNVSKACLTIGIVRRRVYDWRECDVEFAAAFAEAEIEATDHMEAEMYRRAVVGTEKPVYQGKELVGTIREFSDTLLIFMLKARNPAKYRDNVRVELVTQDDIKRVAEDRGLDAAEVAQLAEAIANGKA